MSQEEFNNSTTSVSTDGDPWEHLPPWLQWTYITMFAITVPPAIIMNLLVIGIVIGVGKMRKNANNYPIFSLALADLLTSIFNTPVNFYYMLKNEWVFNEQICKIDQFMSYFFIAASVYTLLASSIDRFRVLCRPFGYPQGTLSKRTMALIMCGIWVVSFGMSIPYYQYYHLYCASPATKRYICKWHDCCLGFKLWYHIFFLIFTYGLPMCSMAYCYYRICIRLWHTRAIGERNEGHDRKEEERKRVILLFISLVLSFAIGWAPYHVYFVIEGFWPTVITTSKYSQSSFIFIYWVAMLNSTINPWLYYKFLPKRRFQQIFKCIFCLGIFNIIMRRNQENIGLNQQDVYDNSRTFAASSRNCGSSTRNTMDTFASSSHKQSLDALTDEEEDAQ